MIITIHQPQFLPWLGYFDKMQQSDIFVLLDDVQFKKNEWQNRNKIKNADGWQWLTVPVLHHFGQHIRDVRINDRTNWKTKHLNALEYNYKKTPYFDPYFYEIKDIYAKDFHYLNDLNYELILWAKTKLGIKSQLVSSSRCDVSDEQTQRLIDLCKEFGADIYLSGASGASYIEEEKFHKAGIILRYQDYKHPTYPQYLFDQKNSQFLSHLSVIDLLFNCGEKSLGILSRNKGVVE